MKKKTTLFFMLVFVGFSAHGQDIPQHISYTRIYNYLDEMANEGYIELNSAVKPYSRVFIAEKLVEIQKKELELGTRQKDDLYFFMEDYALELKRLPDYDLTLWTNKNLRLDLMPPVFTYNDTAFRARIQPILGMNVYKNSKGTITQRWFGVDFQSMIGNHLSVYGSLRDISFGGYGNARLSDYTYLTNFPGYEYKEPSDFSDSRGGVKYAWKWGSVGLVKDNIVWGDNYNGSNIISGRAPSFPMIALRIKPVKWFEMNYIHGWLVSNVPDSTKYYLDNGKKWYRNHNKFIAANMFTFTSLKQLNISFGNSIVYGENNVQPGYLLPVAFYKSIDHTLTKGIKTENQNSQMFFNISSRNIKHLHLFTSVFIDEFSTARLKSSNKERNPLSYKIGGKLTNFPIENLSVTGEFTRTNILVYKHFIKPLTWASNGYNMGHYLGDNAQDFYLALEYKPIRGLDINLSYTDARHGNEYDYLNSNDRAIISQPTLGDIVWTNKTVAFKALYEVYNNIYAVLNIESSNIQGYQAARDKINGEIRMTPEEVLNHFTPPFLQGKNTTFTVGLSFGF